MVIVLFTLSSLALETTAVSRQVDSISGLTRNEQTVDGFVPEPEPAPGTT